jgi:hypothetical protein
VVLDLLVIAEDELAERTIMRVVAGCHTALLRGDLLLTDNAYGTDRSRVQGGDCRVRQRRVRQAVRWWATDGSG